MEQNSPTPAAGIAIGTFVDDRHRVDGVLGKGGCATVYRGVDTLSGRPVAIKVLDPALQVDAMSRARFDREVLAVSLLQSPHTVRVISHGECNGSRFIVFELVAGTDLSAALAAHGALPAEIAVHVLRQLLASLGEAHRAGVLHRDIKPQNIRVYQAGDDPWAIKVLDFGLARFVDPDDARATKTGQLLGTPRYMSPEQLLGEPLGPASDIYSAGITALEMLIGSDDLHGSRLGDQMQRLDDTHRFAAAGLEGTRVLEVVQKMTARSLERRFHSVEAVLHALDSTVETTPLRPPSLVTPAEPESLRPPNWVFGLVLLFVGLLGGVALTGAFLKRDPEPPPPPRDIDRIVAAVQVPQPSTPVIATPVIAAPDIGVAIADVSSAPTPPDGCGPLDWSGVRKFSVTLTRSILDGDVTRDFYIYIPSNYDGDRAHPVILLFQTLGQPRHDMVQTTGAEALADEHGLIIVSFERADAPIWRRDGVAVVRGALERLATEACIDTTRIFAIGHGSGSAFARSLACGARLKGLALSGDIVTHDESTCAIDPPIPILRLAGLKDRYLPAEGGTNCLNQSVRSLADVEGSWREMNGCSGARSRRLKHSGGSCWTWECTEAPFVSCHMNGGHHWTSSVPNFELGGCVGPRTTFPMTETIWDFFVEQGSE